MRTTVNTWVASFSYKETVHCTTIRLLYAFTWNDVLKHIRLASMETYCMITFQEFHTQACMGPLPGK